ncbi:DUF6471 domain-containing protein [Methylobacterium sp. SI9]|uniref:DUF6471 domain-containing protein n=1 Tax=Methylobacterium guangdongense TaxID=3138811 RepID=UPI00313B8199
MTADDTIHAPDEAWDAKVKAILKAELKRKSVTYAQLVDKLAAVGVKETEPNIRNKLARGKFTAVFMIQVLTAVGATNLRID